MSMRVLIASIALASLATLASQAMAQSGGLSGTPDTRVNPMFNPKEYVIHRKQGQQTANPQRSNVDSNSKDVAKRGGWWGKGSDAPGRKKDESAMPAIQNTK